MQVASISDEQNCLTTILTCPLCHHLVRKAHICPNCSKFYCLECIRKQLKHQTTCMNCNQHLNQSILVNCEQMCHNLSLALAQTIHQVKHQKINNLNQNHHPNKQVCPLHNLSINYYCSTCQVAVCSDCCVLTQEHKNHSFIKLTKAKNQYEQRMISYLNQLKIAKKQAKNMLKSIKNEQQQVSKLNNQTQKLEKCIKYIQEQIKKRFQKIIETNESKMVKFETTQQQCSVKYEQLTEMLKMTNKVEFITNLAPEVEKEVSKWMLAIDEEIEEINKSIIETNTIKNEDNFLHPKYQSHKFTIKNYNHLQKQQAFFYTDVVCLNSLKWRLKIYPNGSFSDNESKERNMLSFIKRTSKTEEYSSVFIELVEGTLKKTKRKHILEWLNQDSKEKKIRREFESEFVVGQCWGYDHFAKINTINEEGFIDAENNQIVIILSLAPSNYYEACEDHKRTVHQRKAQLEHNQYIISQIKSKTSQKDIFTQTSLSLPIISNSTK